MSGATTERPFSRTILGAIAAVGFGLFGAGLVLWMQTIAVSADRAYAFLAIMTVVFIVSMVVAARSGRFSASSYGWKQWASLVIPILLLVRVTAFFGAPADGLDGPLGFVGGLLDLTAFILAIVLALTWMAGMRVARNIELLHPQQSEVPPSVRSPQYYEWLDSRGRYVDRAAAIGELNSLAAAAGGLLVGLTAFTVAVGAEQRAAGVVQASLTIMVLYYVCVLVLLSYANLVRRTSQWSLELASQAPGLTGTWLASALVLLVAALVVAMFLPAIDTDAFVSLSAAVVEAALWAARFVLAAAVFVLGLIGRIFEFFRPQGGGAPQETPPEQLREPQGEGAVIDFMQLLAALIVLLVVGFGLYWTFRSVQHNYRNVSARRASRSLFHHVVLILQALLASLLGLLGWTRLAANAVGAAARALTGRRRAAAAAAGSIRQRRPAHTVRQQVHQIYAEVVHHAAACGVLRAPSATPAEYQTLLTTRCRGARAAVRDLTALYEAARYAPQLQQRDPVAQARRLQADVARALQAAGQARPVE